MKLPVYTQSGEKKSEMALPVVLDTKVSTRTLSLYYNYLRAAVRFPVADTLGRGEVSGGGKKPWKQKGTGNARVGSTRSPLWVGGGVTFGPTSERNFQLRMNKQERRRAILGLLSRLAEEGKVTIVESLELSEPKTKEAASILENLKAEGKIAVIDSIDNRNLVLSLSNLSGVEFMTPERLNFIYLMASEDVIITKAALNRIEELFSKNVSEKASKDEESNE